MMEINDYQQALDFLFSYVDFSLTHQEQIAPERFELERMFRLMELLGNPQKNFAAVHIAGTKGKGSVAAHCAAAMQAAGLRTGLYTSPHLSDFRERIQVDGEMIPEDDFVAGMRVLQETAPKLAGVTSYELQTALAFWYFDRAGVEWAAVEVGMGGRLDSTNILTPRVSVITNISYDHTAILGDTLPKIAAEKCGIIKESEPVVSAP
ncbi:MAG: bifunctional folylpolyglutamate synthase/dihydrofolate synthase, partial [Anaerolineales bacterium]